MGIKLTVLLAGLLLASSAMASVEQHEPCAGQTLDLEKIRLRFEKERVQKKLQELRVNYAALLRKSRTEERSAYNFRPSSKKVSLAPVTSSQKEKLSSPPRESTEDLERLLKKIASQSMSSGT